jgi:hypothetical protein
VVENAHRPNRLTMAHPLARTGQLSLSPISCGVLLGRNFLAAFWVDGLKHELDMDGVDVINKIT